MPAAVAYGMYPDQLTVWLEIVPEGISAIRVGMLCRRHADAMVVPRGWTLDDRREQRPRLFRVADTAADNHPSRRNRPKTRTPGPSDPPLQLVFDDHDAAPAAAEEPQFVLSARPIEPEVVVPPVDTAELTVGEIRPADRRDPDETQAMPWRPMFDQDDDLGGLLRAKSPLLARAFRTPEVPPPESE